MFGSHALNFGGNVKIMLRELEFVQTRNYIWSHQSFRFFGVLFREWENVTVRTECRVLDQSP